MPNADHSLLRQLSENSRRYRDPVAAVDWSRLNGGDFWLPEPALSLYGLPEYDMLAVDVRRRLSQYEFINVMHAGLWLSACSCSAYRGTCRRSWSPRFTNISCMKCARNRATA